MAKIDVTRTELVWPGKYHEDGTLKEAPRVNLPFQVIETVNESRATREARKTKGMSLFDMYEGTEGDTFEEGWRNKLIWGDNLLVMGSLLEKFAGKIDLIYIDRHARVVRARAGSRRHRLALPARRPSRVPQARTRLPDPQGADRADIRRRPVVTRAATGGTAGPARGPAATTRRCSIDVHGSPVPAFFAARPADDFSPLACARGNRRIRRPPGRAWSGRRRLSVRLVQGAAHPESGGRGFYEHGVSLKSSSSSDVRLEAGHVGEQMRGDDPKAL